MTKQPVRIVQYEGGVQVSRRVADDEAKAFEAQPDVQSVTLPTRKTHYFPKCGGGDHHALARSIEDTTCKHCLRRRAKELRGWRWDLEMNRPRGLPDLRTRGRLRWPNAKHAST